MYWPFVLIGFGASLVGGTLGHIYPEYAGWSPALSWLGGFMTALGLSRGHLFSFLNR